MANHEFLRIDATIIIIKFHKYPDEFRTAIAEHLVEGAEYCSGRDEEVNLHFTVS